MGQDLDKQRKTRGAERTQLILRGIDQAAWDWDLISGEVYYSPKWWHMLGYLVDEHPASATFWASLCHPDDAHGFDATLTAALASSGDYFNLKYRLRHKKGHYLHVQSRAYIQRDSLGNAIRLSGANLDLTAQDLAQAQLEEAQERYRALVEWSPVGVGIHQDGKIVYANPSAMAIVGANHPSQIIGTPVMDWIHPDFRERAMARVRTSIADKVATPWRATKLLHRNGTEIDVEIQGVPITYLGAPAIQLSFLDITARKRSEDTLRESEARFRALTELSSDWYWEQDENFRFIQISGNVTKITGLLEATYLGKTRWELPSVIASAAEWEKHRAVLNAHQEFREFEFSIKDTQNRIRWASVSGAPIFDAKGTFKGYRGIGRDITAQKQSAEQIHNLAFYDSLTNLPNRRLLLERLKKTEQLDARHQCKGALLFLDLDNFKDLNDTQGHDIGDTLLQQVAKRLVSCVREADNVARLGGDEFVVVLDDLHADPLIAAAQADAVGRKILVALSSPYQLGGREHRTSTSIGITLFGGAKSSVEDQLKQADLALYKAKAAGRNTLRFFDVAMQSDVDGLVALESDLRDGLQGGEELVLLYQPIVDINNRITGVEALVRWHQPARGVVMPETFIPLAEATGLILPLGKWVLQTACHQLAQWAMRAETAHLTLAVNLSARQLHEPGFVDLVLQSIQRAGAPAQRLRLELTESVFINQVEDTIEKMNALKAHGISFSLDDFGTGYSSLSYLKRLPVDLLKIDRTFVRDVLTDPNDASIARTVVALAKNLGLLVVAEGVESEEQREFLATNGCFDYQGYLFGAPMAIEKFDAFLLSGS